MDITLQSQETQAISQAWLALKEKLGVTSIHTQAEYERARAVMNALVDEVRGDEKHPLADLLAYIGDQMLVWEDEHVHIPALPPHEMLLYLVEENQLKQEDLSACVPQSKLSEILSGKRAISKTMAKKLAQRFHVSTDLFL